MTKVTLLNFTRQSFQGKANSQFFVNSSAFMQPNNSQNTIWFQLTALWAFVEATLGGVLHALHIPLTGLLVGGSAVAIISIMAHNNKNAAQEIMKATLIVILVKATASPHSPPPAYIAVAFQGFVGALIFKVLPVYNLATIVFAIIAMLESAVQKILVLTLIYGSSIFKAIDKTVSGLTKEFGLETNASKWILGAYISLYVFWGIIIGARMGTLPKRMSRLNQNRNSLSEITIEHEKPNPTAPNRKKPFWIIYSVTLLLMLSILYISDSDKSNVLAVFLRSITATLLIYLLVNPLFKWLLAKKVKDNKYSVAVNQIVLEFSQLKLDYLHCVQVAKKFHTPFLRYFIGIEYLIAFKIENRNS